MKVIKYDSIGKAVRKVLRDIKILNGSIQDDLEEWVAEALEMMHTTHQMIPLEKDILVDNYGAKLPCGVDSIQAVSYNGNRIRYGERIGSMTHFMDSIPKQNYFTYWQTVPPEIVPNEYHQLGVPYIQKAISSLQAVVQKYPVYDHLFYYIRNGKLETNLSKGDIVIHYLGVPLDEDGFPLVPNNVYLYEAVVDYVDYKLTRRGDKEGRWDIIWNKFINESVPRAVASIEFPSPEQMHSIMIGTTGILKPDYYSRFEL